ncbi:MAG: O-antigen ligase family protein [bacterium]|nr:O-antigen ligase family protein [bacterium]
MNKLIKIFDADFQDLQSLFFISLLLSIPAILLGEYLIIGIPLIVLLMLTLSLGERFIIIIIIVSLFTLVGEVSRTLRPIVYVVDFSLLGYFFLKKYGLNFGAYPQIPKSLQLFLILYFTVMIVSSVMSNYPAAVINVLGRQIALFVIAYVFFSLISSIKDLKLYFNSIYIVAFILVSSSLIAFSNGDVSLLDIFSPNRPRVSAIITNIEASTNFYVVSFPLLICTLLNKKNFSDKKLEYFLLIFFGIGLILTMSRSAIIGITFSTAMIFFILVRKRFYQLLFGIITIGMMFLLLQPLNELLSTFLRIESGMSARDYIWQMSIDMISDHFIFGVGPGAYQYEMFNYFPYMLDDWWGRLFIYFYEVTGGANLSHNFFLTFFTDMGILGLLTAVFLPIVYLRIGIKTLRKYKADLPERYYFIVGLFAAGCSIIIRNLLNSIGLLYVGGIQTDLPFWLIFGSLIYFYRIPLKSSVTTALNN